MGRSRRVLDLMVHLWPLGKVANRVGNWPLVGRILAPLFSAKENEAIIIPVQETISATESILLPYALLTPLVEWASTRFILEGCLCRRAEGCQTYPQDIGCLFLGDGAAEIDPTVGHAVGMEEALAHLQRAMTAGLVPLVVHSSFDAFILGIPYRRMLAVCFCCDCCCVIRQGLRQGPPAFWDTVVRLPGLTVTVGSECVGCGTCLSVCPVQAISLQDSRAQIGEQCKGCGRCAAVCPKKAIALHLTDGTDALHQLLARIERRTDIVHIFGNNARVQPPEP